MAHRRYGTNIGFVLRGEMIPNANSYCEIDPEVKDRFGIPVLRFNFAWTDQERRIVSWNLGARSNANPQACGSSRARCGLVSRHQSRRTASGGTETERR